MLEKLLDLLRECWDRLACIEVLDPYESGVMLRMGSYHRTLEPGWHWKLPLVERCIAANTCVTTMRLPPQTLTTKDDVSVVVAAIVKYQIKDVRPFLLDIWDQADVLADVAAGAIKSVVNAADYQALVSTPPEHAVEQQIRREVNQYGFKVHKVTFTDLGRVRSYRLIQPHAVNLAN